MSKKDVLIIFFAAVILFTVGMPTEFVGFQTRFALFAREMLDNGPTFFPTTYNQPYPDYPSTSTLLIWTGAQLFGEVTPLIAVLPSAIASALILVFTYLIGATCSRRWGILAALFALCTIMFVEESRTISLDQFVSLAALICFYLVHSSTIAGRPWRLGLIPLAMVAGFAFRGPLGLVIPAAVVGGYFFWEWAWSKLLLTGAVSVALLAACMVALLAAARFEGGEQFVKDVVVMQYSGRVAKRHDPFYYYWLTGLGQYAISYPIAVIVALSLSRRLIKPDRPADRLLGHLVIWAVIILAGMSIPGTKNMRYILPIAPAVALIASYLLVEKPQSQLLKNVRFHLVRFFAMSPGWAIAAVIGIIVYIMKAGSPFPPHLLLTLFALTIVSFVSFILKLKCGASDTQETLLTAVAALTFVTMYAGIIGPLYYSREETTSFVAQVESLRQSEPGALVFYEIGPDAEDIKYAANSTVLIQPDFAECPEDILDYDSTAYFVTPESDFDNLAETMGNRIGAVARGNLGHKECVAFKLNAPGPSIAGR